MKWKRIPVPDIADDYDGHFKAIRLNSLGDLYYFAKYVVGYNRLSKLHKYLCASLQSEDLHLVMEVPMSHFKALDVGTLIPTPGGFKLMGHVQVGDTVFGSDGLPTKVTGVSPVYYSTECYELEFTGSDTIVCDAGHLWETQSLEDYNNVRPKKYKSAIRTTKEIASKVDYGKQRNHRVKVARPVQLPEADLPIHPYVLGCWLGDGTSACAEITIGEDDSWLADEINRCGEALRKTNRKLTWSFAKTRDRGNTNSFHLRLKRLGVLRNKHIPHSYMRSSAGQRLAILQGLMDTDGTASKVGQSIFSNTNIKLVEQVRELACSLGFKPGSIGTYDSMLNGKVVGRFHVTNFHSFRDFPAFRMPRKIERLVERSPQHMQGFRHIRSAKRVSPRYVKCIMVDSSDSLYLAGEGFIPTHNTRMGIALSIWWALPFSDSDEQGMRDLGCKDEWIRYMRAVHHQNHRTLVTHEVLEQAVAIGRDVDFCYEHNDLFRHAWMEILPDRNCTWNDKNKFHKRLPGESNDSGTANFLYRGVGQALQGIHANSHIQDDNFGREAQTNLLKGDGRVVADLIRWHQQLATRFDPDQKKTRRRVVLANRWAHSDLNAWIRKNEPEFKFETHSAEGGCCKLHPSGKPILPSEWTIDLLHKERERLGEYDYSYFYLNQEPHGGEQTFKKDWLNYFVFKQSNPALKLDDPRNLLLLEHKVKNGTVHRDIAPGGLDLRIIADPNHAKKTNRAKHVILCVGYDQETSRTYLLSLWAKDVTYSDFVERLYHEHKRWTVHNSITGLRPTQVFMGKSAIDILAFHLAQRARTEKMPLDIVEFDDDDSLAGMKNRIEAMEPVFKTERVWVHESEKDFLDAYEDYPAGSLDELDVLGYFPKTVELGSVSQFDDFLKQQQSNFAGRGSGAGGW